MMECLKDLSAEHLLEALIQTTENNLFCLNGSLLNQQTSTPFRGYQDNHIDFDSSASKILDESKEDNDELRPENGVCDFYETKLSTNSVYIKKSIPVKLSVKAKEVSKIENESSDRSKSNALREEMSKVLARTDIIPFTISDTQSIPEEEDEENIQKDDNHNHESSAEQERRIRKQSIFGHLKTWKLIRLIVKSGDDLKQEQFAMQLITQIDQIFKRKKLKIWLRPYEIIATGKDCGFIEFLADCTTIDAYKKKNPYKSLEDYFINKFTSKGSLNQARDNFARSMAGYSLVCYILQIKDRHNGNILVDEDGHIIHIDFGFMLTNSPGKGINFENVPFKLTDEFVNVMDGAESTYFETFRRKLIDGFKAIQSKAEHLICLVEMMIASQQELACFAKGRERVISELRNRLFPYHGKKMKRAECVEYIDNIISASYNNWRTRIYDGFQKCCQGIAA